MPSKQQNKRKLGKEYRQRRIVNDGLSMDVGSIDGSLDGNNMSVVGSSFVEVGSKGEGVSLCDNVFNISLNDSIVSRSVSPNSISSVSRGGRPKKRRVVGRPKKVVLNENFSNENMNVDIVPEFLSIDLLDFVV
ncbi:unnamed protein product [Meloidogyne enterolobii]|uniref:Uncharacterized protein n=1 Tax=Meloidogyne enterolobii TaxID=390850 RepID=A0ACB0Z5A8_MELEN